VPPLTCFSHALNARRCAGRYAIEDTVLVPADIPAGEYVVGFRWDCEQSTQVWTQCSDITIE
jgi:hypothetical protein